MHADFVNKVDLFMPAWQLEENQNNPFFPKQSLP